MFSGTAAKQALTLPLNIVNQFLWAALPLRIYAALPLGGTAAEHNHIGGIAATSLGGTAATYMHVGGTAATRLGGTAAEHSITALRLIL